jgi:molybdopterin-containing oxidoreductase family membrane subunit
MTPKQFIMGIFKDEDQAASVVTAVQTGPFELHQVHSPVPSHKLSHAMNQKKSMVGWFTLTGGIIGLVTGFLLAVYCASEWKLIVSGKPVLAYIPFTIVGFEFTVLFAVFGNVIGLLTQMDLPRYDGLNMYDARCSGEHFGIVAACAPEQQDALKTLFTESGGDVKVFNDNGDNDGKRE